MQHQDFKEITIGRPSSKSQGPKKIVPKNHTDQRAIKIENKQKTFK